MVSKIFLFISWDITFWYVFLPRCHGPSLPNVDTHYHWNLLYDLQKRKYVFNIF